MKSRPAFSETPHLREYSLRIQQDGRDAETHIQVHLRDTSAIRAARGLAGGRGFEVWRNELCVYAVNPMPREV